MKRFYSAVEIREEAPGWQVTLDGRRLKTVAGHAQIVPTRALAQALAAEWARQGETIDPADFPMRDMADYAIDMVAQDPGAVADRLIAYGDTDTLLYRADPDEPLYPLQMAQWEPILTAFEAREGIALRRVSGIMHVAQDAAAMAHVRARIGAFDPFTLAGFEALTTLSASLTISLSALEPGADLPALWAAASLEEEWQAQRWGREEEAEERRARRAADFLRAGEFVAAARG